MGFWTMDTPADITEREARKQAREDAAWDEADRKRKQRLEDPEEYERDWEEDDDEGKWARAARILPATIRLGELASKIGKVKR